MELQTFLPAQAQAAALMLKPLASLIWIFYSSSTAANNPTQAASSLANDSVIFKFSFPIHLFEVGGVFFCTRIIQKQESHGTQSMGCAPVRIVSQRGESPRQKEVWPDEAEGNCVAAMWGGEQPKAKDSSVTQVNSIRFVTLVSLQSNGEAQMTPTTSKEE